MARRRKLNLGPVLWTATVLNVIAGLALSPITSAAKVRVVGALPTDRDRIRSAVQAVKGKPALRGGAERTLEELYRRPDLRVADWSQNLFRRGLLVLTYDRPIAVLRGQKNTILTSRGQVTQTREHIEDLPEIEFFAAALQPSGSLGSAVEFVKVADVCSRASTLGIGKLWISVQENGGVCLNSGETGRVMLGSPDELDAKFEKLQGLLATQPGVLSEQKEIVLLAPAKAVVRPLGNP